jgi:hypothetical protein
MLASYFNAERDFIDLDVIVADSFNPPPNDT